MIKKSSFEYLPINRGRINSPFFLSLVELNLSNTFEVDMGPRRAYVRNNMKPEVPQVPVDPLEKQERLNEKCREAKKVMIGDGDFSYLRSGRDGHSKFWERFSGKGFSNTPTSKFNKDMVSNAKPQGGNGGRYFMNICTSVARNMMENVWLVWMVALVLGKVATR
ncbi:hypothetical protein MTR67_051300 [Solanum verrucosum]|uniref:Uncharacterized protein n=1 Tax=Solanum verrucosum TaxID=315347 RepID=A0AAF0V4V6_SOLVR|nr:hypothetical protein MTR67_051300 [Solanum verrucosum]